MRRKRYLALTIPVNINDVYIFTLYLDYKKFLGQSDDKAGDALFESAGTLHSTHRTGELV